MLRTNLSTRPFYNVRAVQRAARRRCALVVAGAHAVQRRADRPLLGAASGRSAPSAARPKPRRRALRSEAARHPRADRPARAERRRRRAPARPTRIIDQRAFSWTELFAQFEATLPPRRAHHRGAAAARADGAFVVAIAVEARRVEDLDAFIEALEATGAFRDVLPTEEQTDDERPDRGDHRGRYYAAAPATRPPAQRRRERAGASGAMAPAAARRVARRAPARRSSPLGVALLVNVARLRARSSTRCRSAWPTSSSATQAAAQALRGRARRSTPQARAGTRRAGARPSCDASTRDVLPQNLAGARRPDATCGWRSWPARHDLRIRARAATTPVDRATTAR